MNRSELVMRRRNVLAFINADPTDVIFSRVTRVATTAGSWVESDPTPLPSSQRVRITDAKRRFTSPLVNTEAGDIPLSPYILLGKHDLDIRVHDVFSWRGSDYKVIAIHPDREERVMASIDNLGGVPVG